ncbi:hypothetical protein GGS21DRAFT_491885 [Xylaria nigripes]|nr:hypothetical protein GGS21DRAFT_491885 [Xylaria nigripes]
MPSGRRRRCLLYFHESAQCPLFCFAASNVLSSGVGQRATLLLMTRRTIMKVKLSLLTDMRATVIVWKRIEPSKTQHDYAIFPGIYTAPAIYRAYALRWQEDIARTHSHTALQVRWPPHRTAHKT